MSANYQFIIFLIGFSAGTRVNKVVDTASFCIIFILLADSFYFVNRVLVYFQVSELNLVRSRAADECGRLALQLKGFSPQSMMLCASDGYD